MERKWKEGRPDLRGKKILVVDDTSACRFLSRVTLEETGAEVAERSNGLEALQALAEQKFDLLVLDLVMPSMGGEEILRQLQENNSAIPTIIVTASVIVDEELERKLKELGASDIMIKPINVSKLQMSAKKFAKVAEEEPVLY